MPCIESCLFSLTHALAAKMPDKAFWTLRYQGARDELKSYLSGTDILLVLIIMEVILWSQASQKGLGLWGCRKKEREKYPCSFLRRKILDRDYKLTKVERGKCLAVDWGKNPNIAPWRQGIVYWASVRCWGFTCVISSSSPKSTPTL